MKLLNVNLAGFGQFNKGLDLAFAPEGLTVVMGNNEAGKSTLLSSIVGILFGFRDLNQVRRFEPWDDHETYGGALEMETDDGRRLRFIRDFKNRQASIIELKQGEELPLFHGSADPRGNGEEDRRYLELLGSVLGFEDEGIFRNTVFFGQQSLQTSVSDQIRRLLSGSTEIDYKGALHELHSRYAELTTENPWRSRGRGRKRLIEETRGDLDSQRMKWKEGRETLLQSLELDSRIKKLEEELGQTETCKRDVRDRLEAQETLHALQERRGRADKSYKEALSRRDSFQRYANRSQQIEQEISSSFSQFKGLGEDLPDLLRTFASENKDIGRKEEQLQQETQRLAELKPVPNNSLGFFLAVLTLGLGLAAGSMTELGLIPGAVLGSVLAFAIYGLGRNIGTGHAQAKGTLEGKCHALARSIAESKKKMEEIRDATGTLLVGRSCEQAIEEHRRFARLKEEKSRLQAALKALGGQQEISQAFEAATREAGALDAQMVQLQEQHPELSEFETQKALLQSLNHLKQQAEELEAGCLQRRAKLEALRLDQAGVSARMDFDLAMLEDGIRDKERRLKNLDEERDALKEAIDALDACVKDFQEGDVFRLGEEISDIFRRITENRYTHVHLGASLEPVISRGDSVAIAPEDLSQGARDQLYFAMRVALARHLSRSVRLPLFLDDPFVNFDAERLAMTKGVLSHLPDHQVILVTCDKSYQSWGKEIIDLDSLKKS